MTPFVWGKSGQKMTPQQVERERLAAALMGRDAQATTPVASPFAGINRALQGYLSGLDERRSDAAEEAGLAGADATMAAFAGGMGGQRGGMTASSMGGGYQPAPADPMFPIGQDSVAPPNEMTPGGYAMGQMDNPALDLIRGFEGFRETPYWDVNALRTGYGSDTVTMPDGSVVKVGEGTRVTREDADRDLQRRVETEFMPIAARAVGEDVFAALDPNAQAALTSIAYNYGELPSSVAQAVRSGDPQAAAAAIAALGSHNDGINAGRRKTEAEVFMGGAVPGGNVTMSASGPGTGGGGMDLASILALSSDPWVTQKYGGVIDALTGQAIQQQDPLYQAQLADATAGPGPSEFETRAQVAAQFGLDPDALQSYVLTGELPSAPEALKPTDDIQEWEFYRQQAEAAGLAVLPFNDWMMQNKKAGATNVTVGGSAVEPLGTEGQILLPDPSSPSGYRVEIAPGSKMDQDRIATEKAAETAGGIADTTGDTTILAAKRALEANDQRVFGGLFGRLSAKDPSTPNAEVYRQADALKAVASIENITAMRRASPTGAALGSASDKDIELLKQKHGALDPASPYFERDLRDYTRALLRTIHGDQAGDAIFQREFGQPSGDGASPEIPPAALANPTLIDSAARAGVTVEEMWEHLSPEARKKLGG